MFIEEFHNICEEDRSKLVEEVDRTPSQMIAYQLGWMNLIIQWEKLEKSGVEVITPTNKIKWNNLSLLYDSFYEKYEKCTLKELIMMFDNTLNKIIELINNYTDTELFEPGGRKWAASTPANWPIWKWIHTNTVAPFKSFRTKIRKWKKGSGIKN